MSNDVADCPYCDTGWMTDGTEICRCNKCGKEIHCDELDFESRIDNNRYRKSIGLSDVE